MVFSRQPCQEGWIPPGQPTLFPDKVFTAIPESSPLAAYPHQPGKVGRSPRWTAPTTHFSSDPSTRSIINCAQHNHASRGRTALFSTNWAKLTLDQWVLATVQGYKVPLNQWPAQRLVPICREESQASILLEEVQKLAEKGAAQPAMESQAYLTSPMFVAPKNGGGWRPIIDLTYLNSYLEPQDGRPLHVAYHSKWSVANDQD